MVSPRVLRSAHGRAWVRTERSLRSLPIPERQMDGLSGKVAVVAGGASGTRRAALAGAGAGGGSGDRRGHPAAPTAEGRAGVGGEGARRPARAGGAAGGTPAPATLRWAG